MPMGPAPVDVLALLVRPMTPRQLAATAGVSLHTIYRRLREVGSAAHISHWRHCDETGYPVAVWVAGPGRSAKRPAATPGAVRMQRVRERRAVADMGPFAGLLR